MRDAPAPDALYELYGPMVLRRARAMLGDKGQNLTEAGPATPVEVLGLDGVPDAGEAYLTPQEGGKRSRNFLRDELEGRLRRGPVIFRLMLQLAGEHDPSDDASTLWPADRPRVELGRLHITSISPTGAEDERKLVFDPANRTDGIDLSADPILLARSAAYSLSYGYRSKNQ